MNEISGQKKVQQETLQTFKKHRPSEYFSHLGTTQSFFEHDAKVERLYRFGLTFPPEMFNGKTLIDLGAGTGEHTVSVARWGAKCTLVDMNSDALEVAQKNFAQFAPGFSGHQFISESLYDIDLKNLAGNFDISHSRGVLTHVADKKKAFNILSSLAKPGGYVIYGDRNTAGGIQEMLQRFAIYKLGGNSDEKIVEIAELLFSEDIDRSQKSVPRTREAIIFDRWVMQQQDDPSVAEVLDMFQNEGLEYVSSWPRIDFAARGTSTFSEPRNWDVLKRGARLTEILWMVLNKGEIENIESCESGIYENFNALSSTVFKLRNLQKNTFLDARALQKDFHDLAGVVSASVKQPSVLGGRLLKFFSETVLFLEMIEKKEKPVVIRNAIDGFEVLFKGFTGMRHVDYVAYKPNGNKEKF